MVDFGGWDMPVDCCGLTAEHMAVRTAVGVFDVSHMGDIQLRGPGSLAAVQKLCMNDASKLQAGQAHYSAMLYPNGTFVDDVVAGMLLAAGSAAAVGQTYILAGPRYTDLNELVRATARVLGVGVPRGRIPVGPIMVAARITESVCRPLGIDPPLYPRRVAFFTRNRGFSSEKARRELGYRPLVDLEEGLARMAAWYREIGAL